MKLSARELADDLYSLAKDSEKVAFRLYSEEISNRDEMK